MSKPLPSGGGRYTRDKDGTLLPEAQPAPPKSRKQPARPKAELAPEQVPAANTPAEKEA